MIHLATDQEAPEAAAWSFEERHADAEVRTATDGRLLAVVQAGPEQQRILRALKFAASVDKAACESCGGTGVDGDVDDYGRTIDIPCGECNGSGKTGAALVQPAPVQQEAVWLLELLRRSRGYVKEASTRYYDGTDGAATRASAACLLQKIEAALALTAPAVAAPAQAGETTQYLLPDDLAALARFIETTEDDQSYDIGKAAIKRLAELGAVQSHNFGRYSITAFGHWLHEQSSPLPLLLNSDRDARHRVALKGTGGAA